MKRLKIFSLLVSLIILGSSVYGQNTIQEAIQMVNSITHPNPAEQNKLRAQKAKEIIMARVRTINPGLKVPPEYEALNDELDNLRDVKKASGDELLKWTWDKRAGRCAEQVYMMKEILEGAGVKVTLLTAGNHIFPVVNMADGASLDIPWSWGPDAIVPDTWIGRTLTPEESWNEPFHFDGGKKNGGSPAEKTTLEYLQMIGRNFDRVDSNCQIEMVTGAMFRKMNYRNLIKNYFKIPEEVRRGFDFRPGVDTALEAGKEELAKIQMRIEDFDKLKFDMLKSGEQIKIHALLSDLDGRMSLIEKCVDEVQAFRKKIQATFKTIPKLTTDASIGTVSDVVTDEVPDDIVKNTGEVKVIQYFVFLLTNSSNGLYVGSEDSLKGRTRCSFVGGGIGCQPSDVVTAKKLLGPFASQAEAQAGLCQSITESRIFPIGVGLKGRWQGGSNWYGLWDASISGCPSG